MLRLQSVPKVITFDCYGTLVRWHDAVHSAARAILDRRLAEAAALDQSVALADRLRSVAVERQQRLPYCDYKSVLRYALATTLAEAGHTAKPEDEGTLLSILGRIEPHPDTPAALDRLRTRYRLAVISNTDDDLIAGTIAAIGVPIDFVITAEQAHAYKPDHRLFLHAYDTLGVTKDETVHVGMGQFTDLKVCHELRIQSVWIDRLGEPLNPDWPPDAKLNDLTGLPDLLFDN